MLTNYTNFAFLSYYYVMLNKGLYFNWRSQGKDHRPPVNYDWMVELLLNCLKLDNEMLKHMGGAILSKVYGAA